MPVLHMEKGQASIETPPTPLKIGRSARSGRAPPARRRPGQLEVKHGSHTPPRDRRSLRRCTAAPLASRSAIIGRSSRKAIGVVDGDAADDVIVGGGEDARDAWTARARDESS